MSSEYWIVGIVFLLLYLLSNFVIFTKMGEKGWKGLIPFYNLYVMTKALNLPIVYFILLFVPIIQIVFLYKIYRALTIYFQKATLYPIFLLMFPYISFPIFALTCKRKTKTIEPQTIENKVEPTMTPIQEVATVPEVAVTPFGEKKQETTNNVVTAGGLMWKGPEMIVRNQQPQNNMISNPGNLNSVSNPQMVPESPPLPPTPAFNGTVPNGRNQNPTVEPQTVSTPSVMRPVDLLMPQKKLDEMKNQGIHPTLKKPPVDLLAPNTMVSSVNQPPQEQVKNTMGNQTNSQAFNPFTYIPPDLEKKDSSK